MKMRGALLLSVLLRSSAALAKILNLRFSIIETTCGVDTVSFYYHAVLGRRAVEPFFFNAEGKACKALATYNA